MTNEPKRAPACDYEMDVTDRFDEADSNVSFTHPVMAMFDFNGTTPAGRGWYTVADADLVGFKSNETFLDFDAIRAVISLGAINDIELRGVEIIRELEVEH